MGIKKTVPGDKNIPPPIPKFFYGSPKVTESIYGSVLNIARGTTVVVPLAMFITLFASAAVKGSNVLMSISSPAPHGDYSDINRDEIMGGILSEERAFPW